MKTQDFTVKVAGPNTSVFYQPQPTALPFMVAAPRWCEWIHCSSKSSGARPPRIYRYIRIRLVLSRAQYLRGE